MPDAATWLDEVGRWTPTARWPVLIEDERLAPIFIRAFKPERVIRRASVGSLPDDRVQRERRMDAAVTRAWGGDPGGTSLAALRAAKLLPPGVAITSAADDAWPAAVALAAGRGLPLLFIDGNYGQPNDLISQADTAKLAADITAAIETTGLSFRALGDNVDAIALCRSVGARSRTKLPDAARAPIPSGNGINADDPLSTIDLLGRNDDGSRFAVAGWIFGPSDRAAYMAMCSLFLERGSWWFLSGYPSTEGWSMYAPEEAAKVLGTAGFTTRVSVGEQMSLANWRRLLMGGFDADVLVMNSKGDSASFSLFKLDNGFVHDIPFLDRPAALHLIHSWSLTRPADRYTVGGRLLERGVYAYYGSVQEPALAAFLTPRQLVTRWGGLGPFLISSRYLDGPLDRPWRLTAIGDPLMLCIAPVKRTVPKAPLPAEEGDDVRAAAKACLVRIASAGASPKPADFTEAMHGFRVLGDDAPAVALWKIARTSADTAAAAAKDALPALFRERDFDQFLAAFRAAPSSDDDARDMLWHLASARVMKLGAPILDFLRTQLRGDDVSIDLAALLPAIDASKGRAESDRIVQEEMDRTKNEGVRAKLGLLLRR